MRRRGWRDAGEPIGTRRGDGLPKRTQQGEGHGMRGDAHADRVKAGRDDIRNAFVPRQHKGERTGPECLGETLSVVWPDGGKLSRGRGVVHMCNHGIPCRPALGDENSTDRIGIERCGAKAVHCFRRERHQLAVRQEGDGARNDCGIGMNGIDVEERARHGLLSMFDRATGQSVDQRGRNQLEQSASSPPPRHHEVAIATGGGAKDESTALVGGH